jgi:acetyl esterase
MVQTAEKEVLRDEGEAYARRLDGAGVSVVSTRYNSMIHDCGLLNVLNSVPETRTGSIKLARSFGLAWASNMACE